MKKETKRARLIPDSVWKNLGSYFTPENPNLKKTQDEKVLKSFTDFVLDKLDTDTGIFSTGYTRYLWSIRKVAERQDDKKVLELLDSIQKVKDLSKEISRFLTKNFTPKIIGRRGKKVA